MADSSILGMVGTVLNGVMTLLGMNTESTAAQVAAKSQETMYGQTRSDLQPYRDAGSNGLAQLQQLIANPSSISSNPAYQYRLGQGTSAVNASAAARGGYFSGATGTALQNQGQAAASQEYGDQLAILQNLVSMGAGAATQTGGFGMQATTNAGNYGIQGAQAQNAGLMNINNAIQSGIGSYMQRQDSQDMVNAIKSLQ